MNEGRANREELSGQIAPAPAGPGVEAEAQRQEDANPPRAERVLVCVGADLLSARVVREAARMAESLRAPWFAVPVAAGQDHLSAEAKGYLRANLQLAARLGAEIVPLAGHSVVQEVLGYARAAHITRIIVGKASSQRRRDRMRGSLARELVRQSGPIDVYVICGEEGEPALGTVPRPRGGVARQGYLTAVVIVGACTAVGALLAQIDFGELRAQFDLPDIIMVYLLGVVGVAMLGQRGPALLAAILSAVVVPFFFIPPIFSFSVENPLYWMTVLLLGATGIIVSTLVVHIRTQASAAREQEQFTAALYSLNCELDGLVTVGQVAEAAQRNLSRQFQCEVVVLLPEGAGQLAVKPTAAGATAAAGTGPPDPAVAGWVMEHAAAAGLGTDILSSSAWLFVPLRAVGRVLGVIGLRPPDRRPLPSDKERLLEMMAALVGGIAGRVQLSAQSAAEEVRKAMSGQVS